MKKLIVVFSIIYSVSCSNDHVEKVTPTGIQIDTTNITYSASIVPILQSRCYACHAEKVASSFADGIKLEPYNNLKIYVDNKSFYGSITHDPNFQPMPKGGSKLSNNDIAIIKFWIDKGAPNN